MGPLSFFLYVTHLNPVEAMQIYSGSYSVLTISMFYKVFYIVSLMYSFTKTLQFLDSIYNHALIFTIILQKSSVVPKNTWDT